MLAWFKGLFQPGEKKAPEETYKIRNVPQLDKPILVLMESTGLASLLEKVPSWKAVHVTSEKDCSMAIEEQAFAAFIALSPMNASGVAGRMIRLFRKHNPAALTVYHGWTYNLDVTFTRALACQADLAIVGGMAFPDLVYFLGTGLLLKARQTIEPAEVVYLEVLKQTCKHSPFWDMQDIPCPAGDVE